MAKALASQRNFQTEIISTLTKEAKSSFRVKIDKRRIVYASDPERLTVAIAPIVAKVDQATFPRDLAVVLITPRAGTKKGLLPSGTYLLQCLGKRSQLVGADGATIIDGKTHIIRLTINVGPFVMTIGDCNLCIYWDDPVIPGKIGQCHCHCFSYCNKAIS